MPKYSSYQLSPELKQLACREAGNSRQAELELEQAWQSAASRYDEFFMNVQQRPATATEQVNFRLELLEEFVSRRVWPDTARRIVDECLFGAALLEVA